MIQKSECALDKSNEYPLYFCGDTFLRTRDGAAPFALIANLLCEGKICINCETSLQGKKQKEKIVSLSVDENTLDRIPPNISLVSIVNNHMDDGSDPADLASSLRQRGKIVIGPDNPARTAIEIGDLSFEFFSAYFPLLRTRVSYRCPVATRLEKMIRDSEAQRCVVNLHWGYEHTAAPAPFQRDLARRLVDAGACLVIGHHPHVPQGWEVYRDASIFYSLGNFNFWLFDKEPLEENKWGYMVCYNPHSGSAEPVPYRINDNYQPFEVADRDAEELLSRLEKLCHEAQSIDVATWFLKHYKKWYSHERSAWQKLCWRTKSPMIMLKYMIWLCLPMQIRYYIHVIIMQISLLFAKSPKRAG